MRPPRQAPRPVPRPTRSCRSSPAEIACRLPGSARITMWSAPSNSPTTVRATCRSRRATRCRSTADPTDFPTTKPIRGPASPSAVRRICTTMSGCTARTPCFTVAPKSADRFIRYRAASTAGAVFACVRPSASAGPCDADCSRPPVPPGCASAAGTRAHVRAVDCSAGRSACLWPRLCLLNASGTPSPPAGPATGASDRTRWPSVSSFVSLANRRVPQDPLVRCRIAYFRATVRGY